MITNGKKEYVPYLKLIWKECFGDTDESINLFFDRVYSDEKVLIKIFDDIPVSMLFILELEVFFENEYKKCAYIYGVSTLDRYRGKGFSTELINYVNNKYDFFDTILVPASESLFDFYKLRGYKETFKFKKLEFEVYDNVISEKDIFIEEFNIGIESLNYKNLRDNRFFRNGYACWDYDYINYAIYENKFLGGKNYNIIYKNNNYSVILYAINEILFIKEAVIDDKYLCDILNFIAIYENCNKVIGRLDINSDLDCDIFDFALSTGNIAINGYFNIAFD